MRASLITVCLIVVGLSLWWLGGSRSPPGPVAPGPSVAASPNAAPDRTPDALLVNAQPRHLEVPAEAPAAAGSAAPPVPEHAIPVTLRGRAVDAQSRRPVATAEITLAAPQTRAVTAADGSFECTFPLAEARVALDCVHPDYLPQQRVLWNRRVPKGGVVEPFDFELVPASDGATLVGRLVDERGVPVGGARLRLARTPPSRIGTPPPERKEEVTSRDDGGFAYDGLTPGRWDLLIQAAGLEDHERASLELPAQSRTDLGAIRLHAFAWARLEGRVVDTTGTGIADARIGVWQDRGEIDARSAADGAFAITRIRPGSWRVRFSHSQRSGGLGSLEFGPGETVTQDIVLAAGPHYVGGQVTLGEEPGRDLKVGIEIDQTAGYASWSARTDAQGRFRIDGLPAGSIDLYFQGDRPYALYTADDVTADRDDHLFEFAALARPVHVHGTITDAAGAPVADASVTPFEPESDASRGRTGPDGRYMIEVVLSTDSTNTIIAECSGYVSARARVARDGMDSTGRIRQDLTLVAKDEVGTVEGTVVDGAADAPVRGVECICRAASGRGVWRTHTDSAGRFAFTDVVAGELELILRHRDYEEYRRPAGRLEPGGQLIVNPRLGAIERFDRTIVVRGARGEPLAGVKVDVWRGQHLLAATTDVSGRATLPSLPAGKMNATVDPGGYARHRLDLEVDDRRETDLVLQLGQGPGAIEGVIVDVESRPLVDAEVIVTRPASADIARVEAIVYSDGQGRFRVPHLKEADYVVLVWAGSKQLRYPARPGAEPLRIEIGER
ncbi:MAG: carboxypeptidase regulatory-like domain-containing protein [Planctomycetota bacterium]